MYVNQVVILHSEVSSDASPDNLDVLKEVSTVSSALKQLGYSPLPLAFITDYEEVMDELKRIRPEFVFNVVEEINGNATLAYLAPMMLEGLNIPYTGSSTKTIIATSDKLKSKGIMRENSLPTPKWWTLEELLARKEIEFPAIFKSIHEHASIGLDETSVVFNPEQLYSQLPQREKMRGGCFLESYIEGREFNFALLAGRRSRPEVLPPAEIRFYGYPEGKVKVLGYDAKWKEDTFEYQHTLRSFDFSPEDAPLLEKMRILAQRCWTTFGLKGYARVDFRVDQNLQPWILEVNTNPCISADAGLIAAAERADYSHKKLMGRIIRDLNYRKQRDP
ncbi:MAG: D-alanine--D-alanine ligase [Candidatus Woesearchaeota archaeon]|jgi:D-alanine-D-alanine ligase